MDKGPKYGQMVQNMKANGKIIKHMVKEHFGMFMVINMKVNGKEIKLMALENILTAMEPPMKVIGEMIFNMDTE